MRRWLVLTLLVPCLALAQEKPAAAPNTLTPKEIADGWLLLFDGETTFGWKVDGEAKVEKGELILGGTKATTAEVFCCFTTYKVKVDLSAQGKTAPEIRLGAYKASKVPAKTHVTHEADVEEKRPHSPITLTIPEGTTVRLYGAVLQPQKLQPLFNGKDLTGWKVFKGNPKQAKSKWTVTKEGWLNVKDGAGDLQTEKLFDDFVLQLECISNGKHLNSGLFFRCRPGEYQQGYEAQIRNQFTDKPTQKYTVEDYDPKTYKLLGKKTIEGTAVDYGTGAIYRRVPARKGIAKDGEWFTLTVVANKRHVATFVNGVQVVDWTDNREAKDNGRNGYREAAGAISIQGHDPTTDLSFRNIRVAPLKR